MSIWTSGRCCSASGSLHRKPRGRDRMSYAEIAARLNAERLPSRTGAPWRAGTVRRIVQRATVSS